MLTVPVIVVISWKLGVKVMGLPIKTAVAGVVNSFTGVSEDVGAVLLVKVSVVVLVCAKAPDVLNNQNPKVKNRITAKRFENSKRLNFSKKVSKERAKSCCSSKRPHIFCPYLPLKKSLISSRDLVLKSMTVFTHLPQKAPCSLGAMSSHFS